MIQSKLSLPSNLICPQTSEAWDNLVSRFKTYQVTSPTQLTEHCSHHRAPETHCRSHQFTSVHYTLAINFVHHQTGIHISLSSVLKEWIISSGYLIPANTPTCSLVYLILQRKKKSDRFLINNECLFTTIAKIMFQKFLSHFHISKFLIPYSNHLLPLISFLHSKLILVE